MSSENENDVEENNSESLSENYKYGWGIIQPQFLQKRLNNAKAFLVLMTLANILQGITTNGILKVSVTSIERRFNLLSSESGLIISGYDIAGCLALLPISYLGGKGHKPRWIGMGLMLTSLGSFMISLPHFLTGPYEYTDGISSISSKGNLTALCKATSISNQHGFKNTTDSLSYINCEEILSNLGPYISINQMKYVLLIGQFITGIGCTPIAVLAVTFIDESVDPQVYPIYIGIYYMGALIGPAIGFIVGGQLLKVFTELDVTPEDINSESPQWVGAWWIGFLISAIVMFVLAIPILGYPKKLPSNFTRKVTMVNIKVHQYSPRNGTVSTMGKNRVVSAAVNGDESLCQIKINHQNQMTKEQAIPLHVEELPEISAQSCFQHPDDNKLSKFALSCKHLQDFFHDFLEVVTNKAFMYLSISAAVLGTLVSGFSTFGPKFVESQFGKSASDAANLFGYVCIPAGAGGMLVGAFLMSGLKLGYKSSLRMCFCVSLLGLFGQFALTLHCDDIPMAGVNVPYSSEDSNSNDIMLNPSNPVDSCNRNCDCFPHSFDPVCNFKTGITYYSPCYAGCSITSNSNSDKVFSNCSCLIETIRVEIDTNITSKQSLIAHSEAIISVQEQGKAQQGKCFKPCYWHDIILVGLFLVISTTFICVVPSVDLSLRCFPQHLRSLAVGIQWILIRTLGTIPGPIIFGAMIDSTCLIWNTRDECTEGPGACVMYKNQELSFSILILSVIYKGASILFFGLALLSYTPARLVMTSPSPSPRRQATGPSGESLL